jgi:Tol biopolymer transport system component
MKPESFAAGLLSATDEIEINSVFSPAGDEYYYVIRQRQSERYKLMFTHMENDTWTAPESLRLAGDYSVADIAFSPDGNRLYFCSEMPSSWDEAEGFDIWYVERTETGWSMPVNAGEKINSPGGETQPSFTADGSMYYPSWPRNSATDSVDIYYSRYMNGEFSEPVPLPDSVNSEHNEGNSFVAPDGSYILFARWGMPKSMDGGKGLYISFSRSDGSWTRAKNTKPVFGIYGSLAALSHDGKYLLFSTPQGTHWVDVKILKKLKPEDLE